MRYMPTQPPTRKQLAVGRELAALRKATGWTIEQVADRCPFSTATVSRAEDGRVSEQNARILSELYGADAATTERLARIARSARYPGWWLRYGVDDRLAEYLELESDASQLRAWTELLIPGLLQTEGYARAVILAANQHRPTDENDRRVDLRMLRQERRLDDIELWAVIHEGALTQPVGGPEVMADQLSRLVEASERPNVTLQVLPRSIGASPGMGSTFHLFELDAGPPVAHLEFPTGALFAEEPAEVGEYDRLFRQLTACALDPLSSVRMIGRAAEEMK